MPPLPPSNETIFDLALEIKDAAAREVFLAKICSDDQGRLAKIKKLVAAHEKAEQFFKDYQPAATSPVEPAMAESRGREEPGMLIGVYKLLQKIGEGGCGVVYMAEQLQPVRRRVALKIIKLGMDTKSVIARFEAERQALAMMEHPNIARVLDAGATETGRPFFVMELVNGLKITEYCDQRELETAARLNLFIQVCHAIQHAHQKGIIHRDIKPSNVLVTLHDGMPVPKVIDFGIAKATEERLTDKTLFTAHGHFIGTPAYMSPEQAEMTGLDIDTRSDIYSLGVLLYELLTSKTPFDQSELLQSGLDEMRRTLRERDPHRPSAKLNTMQVTELTATAQHRHVEAPKLVTQLRGDLDWIVMKALEKDRRRRYETANGLALDIQRHLNNEPVLACPPSRLYRFQKLVRRNQGVFAAVGAVAVTLLIGMGTSTWLFLKEREAEHQQSQLRQEAENREQIARAALQISQGKFTDAEVAKVSLVQPSLDGAAVLRALGEWQVSQGRWQTAADHFSQLLQVNQLDSLDTSTRDFFECAVVLASAGRTNEFDNFRLRLVSRFSGELNPAIAERLLATCLVLPASENTLRYAKPFAQVVLPKAAQSIGNPRPSPAAKNPFQKLNLQNIGTDQPCSLTNENGVTTMIAGGTNIWGTADACAFAYTKVAGDFDCQLRVCSMRPILDGFTRVGLMVRESPDQTNGREVMVADSATNVFQAVMRVENNWGAYSVPDNPLPSAYGSNSWVRLQRVGTVFHTYASSNGLDWVQLYQTTGGLRVYPDTVYVGIAASSHSSNQVTTFTVTDLGPTPTISVNLATILALLDYRRGNFPAAADRCNRVLAYPECDPVHVCTAQIILAMVNEQLLQPDQARLKLAAARNLIEPQFANGLEPGNDTGGFWYQWLYARVLLQEATILIEKPALSPGIKS